MNLPKKKQMGIVKPIAKSAVVIDDLVSVDDIQEKIEALSDYVQSTDVQAFSKL